MDQSHEAGHDRHPTLASILHRLDVMSLILHRLILALVVLVLAACQSTSEDSTVTPTPSVSAADQTTATATDDDDDDDDNDDDDDDIGEETSVFELETGDCFSADADVVERSEEHTSELQSPCNLVCRLLLEKKKKKIKKKSDQERSQ